MYKVEKLLISSNINICICRWQQHWILATTMCLCISCWQQHWHLQFHPPNNRSALVAGIKGKRSMKKNSTLFEFLGDNFWFWGTGQFLSSPHRMINVCFIGLTILIFPSFSLLFIPSNASNLSSFFLLISLWLVLGGGVGVTPP